MVTIPMDVAERAATRYVEEGDCHISTYSVGSHGYAQIGWFRKSGRGMVTAQAAALVFFTGEQIPAGHEADHLCHVPRCVRREHLQVATSSNNHRMTRGHFDPSWSCPKNHGFEHRTQQPNGRWVCQECARESRRKSVKKKQESA